VDRGESTPFGSCPTVAIWRWPCPLFSHLGRTATEPPSLGQVQPAMWDLSQVAQQVSPVFVTKWDNFVQAFVNCGVFFENVGQYLCVERLKFWVLVAFCKENPSSTFCPPEVPLCSHILVGVSWKASSKFDSLFPLLSATPNPTSYRAQVNSPKKSGVTSLSSVVFLLWLTCNQSWDDYSPSL
jgi:hypothetical protein